MQSIILDAIEVKRAITLHISDRNLKVLVGCREFAQKRFPDLLDK